METIDLVIVKSPDGVTDHYRREDMASERYFKSLKSFTCFIAYMEDGTPEVSEEIDVLASDDSDARIVCEAALLRDYDPGGKVHSVRENIPGMMYF